jgi:tetratricopeptide (TPR) repeat protein
MTDIKILYDKIYTENLTHDPKRFINLYDDNKNLIEGADPSTSNPDYDGIMRITSDYALSLSYYGSSRKAIPYLDKSIQLFKDSSVDDLTKVPMYEILVWTRGFENYNQKKYSLAEKDFQYLVDNYPDNDKYRNWLLASKTIKVKRYSNYIWFGVLICVILESLVNKENATLKFNLLIIAAVLFLFAIIIEIFHFIVKAKIKKQ